VTTRIDNRHADATLSDRIMQAMRTVQDPELPINLVDLGLIYALTIDAQGAVAVEMTLTTPNCPVAESMPSAVSNAVKTVDGVGPVDVRLVWEPAWSRDMMSNDARLQLEMMGIDWSDPSRGPQRSIGLTINRTPPA
jgi:FeS assembly SUF system protein